MKPQRHRVRATGTGDSKLAQTQTQKADFTTVRTYFKVSLTLSTARTEKLPNIAMSSTVTMGKALNCPQRVLRSNE